MNSAFKSAVERLLAINAAFLARELTSVQHGNQRGASIAEALTALALEKGCNLDGPMHIDSRGDYRIVATRDESGARFGEDFAVLLNAHRPRCGIAYTAVMEATSSWCYLNHFEAEKLVIQAYNAHLESKLQ